jgi:hypothetical protein
MMRAWSVGARIGHPFGNVFADFIIVPSHYIWIG